MILPFRLYVLIIMGKRRKIQVFTKMLISPLWYGHTRTIWTDWKEQATRSFGKNVNLCWLNSVHAHTPTHTHMCVHTHQINEVPTWPYFWWSPFGEPFLSIEKMRRGQAVRGRLFWGLIYKVYLYPLLFSRKPCKWCLYALNCDNWTDELKTWLNI